MRRKPLPLLALAVFGICAALQPRHAAAAMLGDATVPFSADRTVTVNGHRYVGKLFATPGHQRHEQDLLGMREVFLLDVGRARGFLLVPAVKTYVEFPFPTVMAELDAPDLTGTPAGQETVHGIRTTRYRIDHTAADGSKVTGLAWVSRSNVLMKFDVAILRAGSSRPVKIAMELSNLLEEAQDPSLFELPPGLARLPAEALGPLMGGNGG